MEVSVVHTCFFSRNISFMKFSTGVQVNVEFEVICCKFSVPFFSSEYCNCGKHNFDGHVLLEIMLRM
jgi:hypothetical protein